ncbi:protein-disulfide reductase DsbD [uncultured Thiodictyon sp.]|uniref:protein-disulfide reductase DsbD n=1 Tax=uncultured Thiodictyon sp. TaxID=1846217 RepID=UPI0025DC051F|nr:protein-disulfide reductase DsbD [uncultured Thiodictyon sp.]
MRVKTGWAGLLLLIVGISALAADDFLPPEQAFEVSAQPDGPDAVRVRWLIAEGYYLYQGKLRFATDTPEMTLGSPALPAAETKQDAYFGEVKIYRHQVEAHLPVTRQPGAGDTLTLEISAQGCADAGLCYPPQRQQLRVTLPRAVAPAPEPPALPAADGVGARVQRVGQTIAPTRGLGLPDAIPSVEEAFVFQAQLAAPDRLELTWTIAPGTYLDRDQIVLALDDAPGVRLGAFQLPPGTLTKDGVRPDGSLGEVAVYRDRLDLNLPLVRSAAAPTTITLVAKYRGCAEQGICYPPQTQRITLDLPALPPDSAGRAAGAASAVRVAPTAPLTATAPTRPADPPRAAGPPAEQDRIAAVLAGGSLLAVVALFFGFGLLLAFTPCVFPMIPILSGIIAGHGAHLTTRRAFTLSLIYVLAMALTYTTAGVLAGLFGANLQAVFQNPWILTAFALVFVALALSMFGFYHLQLPSALHARLAALSHQQRGGTLIGVAVMGVLSALIVGPCVAPPLFGALIYISQTGDAVLGGVALFSLSLGMGAPLIIIGTSAGQLLPRAGSWMGAVNAVFGVALLGVAIALLERILPAAVAMLLWGLLLIGCAVYLGALTQLPPGAHGWDKLWKGLGVGLLIYGALMLVGAAAGGKDTLQPLRGLPDVGGAGTTTESLAFKRIKTLADLDRELAGARAAGRPVMLDFYADWCVSCKELERDTFSDPAVIGALKHFVLLQADVTANDAADQALMQGHFKIPGPPAMLFFDPAGAERPDLRLVGFTPAPAFVAHLRRVGP